jgi:hypothetical protein
MSDIDDLKRRAGITEMDYPQDGPAGHAYKGVPQIADTFKNGNIKDAFEAIGSDVSLFARVAIYLNHMDKPEFERFLKIASKRGQ